jgi:hypothetical protein
MLFYRYRPPAISLELPEDAVFSTPLFFDEKSEWAER